jgi:sarcosine oxidase gamma subunit
MRIGPDVWLGFAPTGGPGWARDLAAHLSGQAWVVDQSGGYRLFGLTGPDAARLLQKGCRSISILPPFRLEPSSSAPLPISA